MSIEQSPLPQENLRNKNKSKISDKVIKSVLIGFLLGVACYAFVFKGLSWPFIFPLVLIYLFFIRKAKKVDGGSH